MNGIIQIKYSTIPRSNPKYTRYHHKAYILSLKQQNLKKTNWRIQKYFKTEQDALWNTDAPVPIFDIDRRTGQTLYAPESSIPGN
jgi:hypothetical protein